MKKKLLLTLSGLLLALNISSSALAISTPTLTSEPDYVAVCPVHSYQHVSGSKSFEKYAYQVRGTLYNSTCHTCACGAQIYTTDESSYFYNSDIEWHFTPALSYAIIKNTPRKFYTRNPPNWSIGLVEY